MKILKKICPICVLVGGTWIVLLALRFQGYNVSESFVAMLMGGSTVGISYVLANKINGSTTVWKLISVPIGFAAMYALLNFSWGYFTLAILAYFVTWLLLGSRVSGPKQNSLVNIKKELNDCC